MITERDLIYKWKTTDFSTFNETDVRENFISDLLYILGYSKNTIHDITTEKSLKLSESLQRLGRKRIKIDYVPTIRLKAFWILEAKPGTPKEMETDDMLQAYLYATHPEIQAPFIVLCNGWELKIYDVHNYSNWLEPIFSINSSDCNVKFTELREILGAESILKFQRQDLLRKIHNTFEVEIDESQLSDFCREFEKEKYELRTTIKENASQLWRKEYEKRDETEKNFISRLSDEELVRQMELSNSSCFAEEEYKNRITISSPEHRTRLIRRLNQSYLGRSRGPFKCRYLRILIFVYEKRYELAPSAFLKSIEEMIVEAIDINIFYWKNNAVENRLCFLDRSCCRLAALIAKNGFMDFAITLSEDKKKSLPKEVVLTNFISPAHEVIPLMLYLSEALWYVYSRVNSESKLDKIITMMERNSDNIVARLGVREFPDHEHDLYNYEKYGDHFDYLSSASCSIVASNYEKLHELYVDENMINLIMSRNYEAIIPKYQRHDTVINEEDEREFAGMFAQALKMGISIYGCMLESKE